MKLKHLLMVSLLALSLFSTSAARACEPQGKGIFSWFHHSDSDHDREREHEKDRDKDSNHNKDSHHECSGKGQTTPTSPKDPPVYK